MAILPFKLSIFFPLLQRRVTKNYLGSDKFVFDDRFLLFDFCISFLAYGRRKTCFCPAHDLNRSQKKVKKKQKRVLNLFQIYIRCDTRVCLYFD